MSISTARLRRECEGGTFCHEMAYEVCRERDQLTIDLAAARAEAEAMKADRLKLAQAYDPNCDEYAFCSQRLAMGAARQTVEAMQELATFLGRDPEGCLVDCADEAIGRIERAEEKADELTSQAAAFAGTELVTEEWCRAHGATIHGTDMLRHAEWKPQEWYRIRYWLEVREISIHSGGASCIMRKNATTGDLNKLLSAIGAKG